VTGAFDFDPQRYVRAEEPAVVEPLYVLPSEWAEGLRRLATRRVPRDVATERWTQIVADATRLATCYGAEATAAGWNVANLFGYDPAQENGWIGLVVRLRGRPLVGIRTQHATIKLPGGYIWHRPEMPAGSPLIWDYREPVR